MISELFEIVFSKEKTQFNITRHSVPQNTEWTSEHAGTIGDKLQENISSGMIDL